VFTTNGGASGAGAWRIEDAKATHPSVMLFDLNAHVARRLPVDWDAPDARWFKAGETFLAGGDGASYGVYGLDGQRVESPMTQGNLTSDVVPVPDGSAVLVGRTDDQYIVSALPDGGGGTFLTGARHLAFAPDGLAIAWLAFGTYDKGGNVHPGRVIYVNHAVGRLIGFAGGGTAVEQDFNDQSLIDLAPNPWSPDGKYLLVERRAPCAPTVASCDNPPDFEVYAVPGASFDRVWSGYKGELSSAQWAGANRLLVTFSAGHVDPQFNTSQTFVPLFGGQPAPVPSIVRSSCCPVVAISPNGRYAIAYTGADNGQRCALFDMQTPPSTPNTNKAPGFTWTELASIRPAAGDFNTAFGFCSHAEWTPDGSMVIVSSSAAPTSAQR
jgi:hypothetical protein